MPILSAAKPDDIINRIVTGDVKMLSSLPGIGPKSAQRMAFFFLSWPWLPPFCLQVLDVDVTALLDSGDGLADVVSVLKDGVALLHRRESDFVADGNGVQAFHPDGLVALHDPTGQHLALLDPFDNDDADGIGLVMDNIMRSGQRILPKVWMIVPRSVARENTQAAAIRQYKPAPPRRKNGSAPSFILNPRTSGSAFSGSPFPGRRRPADRRR